MIVFDKEKKAKYIIKNGLDENDADFNLKMWLAASHLIHNTKYAPCTIKEKLANVAIKYFYGMPDVYIESAINQIYDKAKCMKSKQYDVIAYVYKSELNRIMELKNYNLQKLAFVLLVYSKYCGYLQSVRYKYKWIDLAMPDMFRLADIKASSKTKNELVHGLVEAKMLCINSILVKKYSAGRNSKIMFYVPYQCENQDSIDESDTHEITIKNFDEMILYFKRYLKEDDVESCCMCSEPILKTSNSRKFCGDCAAKSKRLSNRNTANKVG